MNYALSGKLRSSGEVEVFGRSRAQGRLLAARYEERNLRKIIVSVSVLLAALIAVSVAFAAGTTTLEIKPSPNKVSKSKSKLTRSGSRSTSALGTPTRRN